MATKYKGKYPTRIKTVSYAGKGVVNVQTNAGQWFKLTASETGGNMPKLSQDIRDFVLGPMTVSNDGTVTQNPTPRIKRGKAASQPSQATGLPPSERLVKRRRATAKQPMPGVWANPLTRVRVTSPSQRMREGADGPTDSPSGRLRTRRKTTKAAPAGFYANPAPSLKDLVFQSMNYVVYSGDMYLAAFPAKRMADEYRDMMKESHPSRDFRTLPLD